MKTFLFIGYQNMIGLKIDNLTFFAYIYYKSKLKMTAFQQKSGFNFLLLTCLIFSSLVLFSQQKPILLTESTFVVKNRSSERFYFGLAAGDKLNFSIDVSSSIKNISFQEYNGNIIFELSNTDSISNHSLEIEHDGIYYFSFEQSGFLAGKRTCSLKANRVPKNRETEKFNTTVYWETKIDTIRYTETEKYLARVDTLVSQIVNQTLEVPSKGVLNSANIMFNLPDSVDTWSYFVASGKDAGKTFLLAEQKFSENSTLVKKHGLMAGIAMNGVASFSANSKCTEFDYGFVYKKFDEHISIVDSANALMALKKTCMDFSKIQHLKRNPTHILLRNNSKKKLKVHVRITAVEYKKTWATREIPKIKIETREIPYLKK